MNKFQKFLVKIASLFYPCKVYGKNNIPKGSAVLACNHFSAIDCLYFLELQQDDLSFLAKKELFKNKLFAKILKFFGAIPINRENPEIRSLMSAIKVLKDGKKLTIFPEGTRNKSGSQELQELKGGTAVFAVKAKCPIVPIMLYKKARLFVKNKMIIGKPFTLEEFYNKPLDDAAVCEMDKLLAEKMIEQQALLNDLVASKRKKQW